MHILVTNDDGVQAPGLLALAQAMKPLGQVTILAPNQNWTAGGHVKTLHRPLRVRHARLDDGTAALASDGAPSDCVALAMLGLVEEKIDLVVSGINPNANMGHDITYSGTVTAAMEAVIHGVPGIAFSLDSPGDIPEELDFSSAAEVAQRVVRVAQSQELAADLLLNVNIPYLPLSELKGLCVTRQGLRVYHDKLDMRHDPRGRPYYWIGGEWPTGVPDNGTDIGMVAQGYVSITPLRLDLTDRSRLELLQSWDWE